MQRFLKAFYVLVSLTLLSSCGFFTAGAVVATADDGAVGNAATVGSDLSVTDPSDPSRRAVTSPAAIRFRLTDQEGDGATVRMFFSLDGGATDTPTSPPQLTGLASGPNGVEHILTWDFLQDLGSEEFEGELKTHLDFIITIGGDGNLL